MKISHFVIVFKYKFYDLARALFVVVKSAVDKFYLHYLFVKKIPQILFYSFNRQRSDRPVDTGQAVSASERASPCRLIIDDFVILTWEQRIEKRDRVEVHWLHLRIDIYSAFLPVDQPGNGIEPRGVRTSGFSQNFSQPVKRVFAFAADDIIRPRVFHGENMSFRADFRTSETDLYAGPCFFQIGPYGFNLFNIPYVARKANHVAVCSYQLPEYIRGVVVDGEFPYHHLIRRVSHNSIDIPDGRIRVYILRIQCCQ